MPRDSTVVNPFLGETVGGMLAAVAARVPDGLAIVATDRRISYRALHEEAQRFARALLALGIRKDEVPRHVRIVADVPRTPGPHGDKVQKAKLRELFLAEAARLSDSRPSPPTPG